MAKKEKKPTKKKSGNGKKTGDIQVRKLQREITFKLKGAEIEGLGILLSKQILEKVDIENEFKKVSKEWKGKIEAAELALMQTTKNISDRSEQKVVWVEERKDFNKRIVEYLHEGKVVESREMDHEDLQTEMPVDALKTEEAKTEDENVADVIKMETGKKTKTTPLDQPTV